MKLFLLIASLVCASAQDIFVPFFEAASAAPGQNNLLTSLIAFYRFEEAVNVTAQDSSPADRDLAVNDVNPNNPSLLTPAMVGDAKLYIGGATSGNDTDYYKRSDATSPFAFSSDFTIAGWIKQDSWDLSTPLPHFTLASLGTWSSTFSWALMFDKPTITTVNMSFYWNVNALGTAAPVSVTTPTVGVDVNWHFVYVKRQGGTVYISTTDASAASLTDPTSTTISTASFYNAGTLELEVGNLAGLTSHDFQGGIDELGFWNRALTSCELNWLFSAKNHSFTYTAPFDTGPCSGSVGSTHDGFDVADTDLNLVPNWAGVQNLLSVGTGKVYSHSAAAMTGARRTSPTFGANQRAWVTLSGNSVNQGTIGPAVRMQSGSQEWYGLFYDSSSDTLYLFQEVAGSYSGIGSFPKTYVDGNKLRISVTGTGAATRLSADEDTGSGWVNLWTNMTPPSPLDSGQPGITGYNFYVSSLTVDEWFAEEF